MYARTHPRPGCTPYIGATCAHWRIGACAAQQSECVSVHTRSAVHAGGVSPSAPKHDRSSSLTSCATPHPYRAHVWHARTSVGPVGPVDVVRSAPCAELGHASDFLHVDAAVPLESSPLLASTPLKPATRRALHCTPAKPSSPFTFREPAPVTCCGCCTVS